MFNKLIGCVLCFIFILILIIIIIIIIIIILKGKYVLNKFCRQESRFKKLRFQNLNPLSLLWRSDDQAL